MLCMYVVYDLSGYKSNDIVLLDGFIQFSTSLPLYLSTTLPLYHSTTLPLYPSSSLPPSSLPLYLSTSLPL